MWGMFVYPLELLKWGLMGQGVAFIRERRNDSGVDDQVMFELFRKEIVHGIFSPI